MAAATPDRLSDLPDELLIHILSFAPTREAASTTALARRWRRTLWLETGVINFDYRSYITTGGAIPLRRVWDDACRVYNSHGRTPRKLTLVICNHSVHDKEEEDADAAAEEQENASEIEEEQENASEIEEEQENAGLVFAAVEEIWVERQDCASPADCYDIFYSWMPFVALRLRVLEITGWLLKPDPDQRGRRLEFPCLEAIRLRRCRTEIATLQDMISAAPRFANLLLEAVYFEDYQYEYCLRCPAATVIVMADIQAFSADLHFRTYFSFEPSEPPGLEHVHLAVHFGSTWAVEWFRSFLTSMCHIRFLKLTAYSIADLDSVMQYNFYNLEALEIEDLCGWCIGNDGVVVNALVNLLRQCPGLRELRLRFSWCKYLQETTDPAVLSAAMSDFPVCKSFVNSGDDDDEGCLDGLDLIQKHCGGCKLNCLRSTLTRVVVKFDADELTCFQVRLVKFLAKNAMALEEFIVDAGNRYDSGHIDRKIKRWRKRKRWTSSPIPAMTQHPLWPPLLSEFPPLGRAPDVDPIAATPCSEAQPCQLHGDDLSVFLSRTVFSHTRHPPPAATSPSVCRAFCIFL
ncbi:unnamed protein product [Alopecurus aequalis]